MASIGRGEEAKPKEEEKKPPRAILALPLAIPAGRTNKVQIRGQNLTNVTEVRLDEGAATWPLQVLARTKLELPKDAEAKRVGDSMLELELQPPAEAAGSTNHLVLKNPDGSSGVIPIVVLAPASLTDEQEPNGGFRSAQRISFDQTVRGTIKEAADVDVFRFEGRSGQRIRLEVVAAALGSSLDSVLSLFDAEGHALSTVDDVAGQSDSVVSLVLPRDGAYFATILDAQDRGGATYVYLFRVTRLALEK